MRLGSAYPVSRVPLAAPDPAPELFRYLEAVDTFLSCDLVRCKTMRPFSGEAPKVGGGEKGDIWWPKLK